MEYEIRPSVKTPGMMGIYRTSAEGEEEIYTGSYTECLVQYEIIKQQSAAAG